jgi:hypothetical protein
MDIDSKAYSLLKQTELLSRSEANKEVSGISPAAAKYIQAGH